jgi:hypothetical protein
MDGYEINLIGKYFNCDDRHHKCPTIMCKKRENRVAMQAINHKPENNLPPFVAK